MSNGDGSVYLKGSIDYKIDRFISNGLSPRTSPEFELLPQELSDEPNPKIYCELVVYPNGDAQVNKGSIACFVRFPKLPPDYIVEIDMELIANNYSTDRFMMFESKNQKSWGTDSLARRDEVLAQMTGDELTVKCLVEVFGKTSKDEQPN
ncbi:unnamed protein product [Bursaphelenchus okinawaensis]|uniref:MATH domain-containing protein n=1 Tax=Bursaphelenchus okinawaensis TaxID=465554 RepID=A0A811LLM8_9BILA|nr:unnamed protein product [Bursaphelenchus okinawaensis]CAG9127803.1 unnamed protein product [Bursaphelenchus okinawaensis]